MGGLTTERDCADRTRLRSVDFVQGALLRWAERRTGRPPARCRLDGLALRRAAPACYLRANARRRRRTPADPRSKPQPHSWLPGSISSLTRGAALRQLGETARRFILDGSGTANRRQRASMRVATRDASVRYCIPKVQAGSAGPTPFRRCVRLGACISLSICRSMRRICALTASIAAHTPPAARQVLCARHQLGSRGPSQLRSTESTESTERAECAPAIR